MTEFEILRPCYASADIQLAALRRLHARRPIDFHSEDALLLVRVGAALVLKHVKGRCKGDRFQRDELIQAGMLGVLKAIETFDVSRDCRFSTHCVWQIRGAISGETDRRRRIDLAEQFIEDLGLLSLAARSEGEDPLVAEERNTLVRECISLLPDEERTVVTLHYGIDRPRMTFREIDRHLGVGRDVARYRFRRAMDRLRRAAGVC